MKTTLLASLLLCPFLALAQAKAPAKKPTAPKPIAKAAPAGPVVKMEGIGKFKIGKTTLAIIPELEAEMEVKVKRVGSYSDYAKAEGGDILELIPDATDDLKGPPYASLCPAAKVYMLPAYKVADIYLANVKLTFYNDILIDFHCDGSTELIEALGLKYGKPSMKKDEKDVPCTFTHTGNKIVYKEVTYTQSWNTPPLAAEAILMKYYDSKCKDNLINYFSICDPAAAKKMHACESTEEARRDAAEITEKKKKLGDL
nr:hypothetical protein [Tanacetum cinerariifolium]